MTENIKAAMGRLLYRCAAEAVKIAQQEAPVVTGNLMNDIKVYDDKIDQGEVRIGNSKLAYYAVYVHEGTGLYGPKKAVIRPQKKKALRTPWGPRKFVRGQRANRYMLRAFSKLAGGGIDKAVSAATEELGLNISTALDKTAGKITLTVGK